jgi:hypothetical protein
MKSDFAEFLAVSQSFFLATHTHYYAKDFQRQAS